MAKIRCSFLRDERLNVHGTIVEIDSEGLLDVSGEEKDILLSLKGFALVDAISKKAEVKAEPKKVEEKVEEKEEPKKTKSTKKNTKK